MATSAQMRALAHQNPEAHLKASSKGGKVSGLRRSQEADQRHARNQIILEDAVAASSDSELNYHTHPID